MDVSRQNGIIVMSKEEILDRWEEYIAELYYDERNERPEVKKALEGPPITKDEIEVALKKIEKGKSTGQQKISVEMIKAVHSGGARGLLPPQKFSNLSFFLLYNVYHIRLLNSCSYSNLQTTYTLYADNITYSNNGLLPLLPLKMSFGSFCFVKYKFHVAEF